MSPLFMKSYSASTTDQNLNPLSGWQYEYLPWHASVEVAVVQQKAKSTTAVQATYSCYSGSDLLAQAGTEAQVSSGVIYPESYNLTDVAAAGERLGISLFIPGVSSASQTIVVACRVTPF